MVTEVDHDAIKEAIEGILESNATLYDATGADDKIRQINVGHPDHPQGFEDVFPSIYITNANPLERIRQIGSVHASDEVANLEHVIRYKIVLQAQGKSSRVTENTLDDWQKIILETLEADHKLKNGGSANVDHSRPEMIETFRQDLNGKRVQGRIITYLCTKVTT